LTTEGELMTIDRLVGLKIEDEQRYQEYRNGMMPILEAHGGRFVVDVKVSEVLRAPDEMNFNRLFTIRFPDEEAMNRFFSNEEYLAVREAHFDRSVASTAQLGRYEVLG
jgi:uncharacterized protein (DUF1330 family)